MNLRGMIGNRLLNCDFRIMSAINIAFGCVDLPPWSAVTLNVRGLYPTRPEDSLHAEVMLQVLSRHSIDSTTRLSDCTSKNWCKRTDQARNKLCLLVTRTGST